MDLLNMLMTARVLDTDGVEIGNVLAIRIMAGHLLITVLTEDEEEGDDDDGEEVTPRKKLGSLWFNPLSRQHREIAMAKHPPPKKAKPRTIKVKKPRKGKGKGK